MKFAKSPIALGALALFAAAPMAAHAVTVTFKAPSSGTTLNNVTWNQSSACEVAGQDIRRVQFYLINSSGNRTALNNDTSSPWRCNLESASHPDGKYTLRAYAYDSSGREAISSRSITITNGTSGGGGGSGDAQPTISFSAPANNATINRVTTCRVNARDDRRVQRVQFYLDGALIGTDSSSSYQCSIDNRKYTNGAHTLKAVVTDSANQTAETQITINVTGGSGGGGGDTANTPPILSITAPAAGSKLAGSVPYSATASDTGGAVAKVEMYLVSGSTQKLVDSKTAAPYSGSISTAGVPNGAATLMAVATDNLGATSSVQRSVTVDNTVVSNPGGGDGGGGSGPIASSDIITRARADVPFSQQSGFSAQAMGKTTSGSNIPESGIHGSTLPNGETLRLGKTSDPTNSLLDAFAFQVRNSDPTTSAGKRSELSITPNIEMNKVYWIVFSAYVEDWGTLGSNDNALFGAQMHTGDNQAGVGGPSFGIYTTQNGRKLRVQARYSTSSSPSSGNSVSVKYADHPFPFHRWTDFVLKFKHNTSGNGFLQVWMDGEMIANHQGSLGYNTGMKDYAKFGYYNWSGSGMSSTPRKVLLRSPTIVNDPSGSTYNHDQVRALLGTAVSNAAAPDTSASSTVAGAGTTTASNEVCSTAACVLTQ